MSRTATQLAGNASSIFQAWLDLQKQSGVIPRNEAREDAASSNSQQRSNSA